MTCIRYELRHESARAPEYKSAHAAGADLYAVEDVELQPNVPAIVRTGVALAIPVGLEGQVRPRSGLSVEGVVVALGTIDADYRGGVGVIMTNTNDDYYIVKKGDRVAQLVIAPVVLASFVEGSLDSTERGTDGFGSTGV